MALLEGQFELFTRRFRRYKLGNDDRYVHDIFYLQKNAKILFFQTIKLQRLNNKYICIESVA